MSLGVDKPMNVFGVNWDGHENKIKQGWDAAGVTAGDAVVIPGDISWALKLEDAVQDFKFLHSLKGVKIIGKGNHDLWWDTDAKIIKMFAENGFDSFKLLRNSAVETGEYIICGSRGWYMDAKNAPADADYGKIVLREKARLEMSLTAGVKLKNSSERNSGKEIVVFMHFPPVYNGYICGEFVETLCKYGIKRCYYGHIHSVYGIPPSAVYKSITFTMTSADFLDFTPLKI